MTTNRQIMFVIQMKNQAQAALASLGSGFRSAGQGAAGLGAGINNAAAGASRLASAAKGAAQQMNNVKPPSGLGNGFKNAAQGANSLSESARLLVGTLAGVGAGLAAINTVQVFSGLERQLSVFKAVTQATTAEMAQVKAAARQMGADTEFSTTQAAEALTNFARAGMTVQQSMDAAKATLDFALVSGTDLGTAAATTAAILNQFQVAASKTSEVIDILAKVDNMSAASADSLGESFKYAGTVANSAGVSMNTLAAAIGVLGDAGTLGSTAGTQLQQVIAHMINPTSQAQQALKELGLTMGDLDPKNLDNTFTTLKNKGLTAGQALRIFGEEGGRAAILLSQSPEKLKRFEDATKSAGGTAAEAARVIGDNLTGDFRQFMSAVEDVQVGIGDAGLLGALRIMTQGATEAVLGISHFLTYLTSGVGTVDNIKVSIVALSAAILTLAGTATAVLVLQKAWVLLNVTVAANPYVLVISALAALAAALYVTWDNTVRWGDATTTVGDIVIATWDELVALWGTAKQKVSDLYDYITGGSGAVSGAFASISRTVSGVMGGILTVTGTVIKDLVNDWIAYAISTKDIFLGLAKVILDVLTGMYKNAQELVGNIIEALKDVAKGDFSAAGEAMGRQLSTNIVKGVEDNLSAVGDKIKENFSTDYVQSFVDGTQQLITDLKNGAIQTMEEVKARAAELHRQSVADRKDQDNGPQKAGRDPDTTINNPNSAGAKPDPSQIKSFTKQLDDQIQKLKDEQAVIGMNTVDRERMTAALNVEREARKAGVTDTKLYVEQYLKEYDALKKLKDAYEQNPIAGIQQGFDSFIEDNLKMADKIADAWNTALDGISENLTNLIVDGNSDFAGMLKNFGKSLLNAGFKNLMAQAFQGLGLNNLLGSSKGAGPSTIASPTATVNATNVTVNGASVGGSIGGGVSGGTPVPVALDGQSSASMASNILKGFEGYQANAKFDVNAYRAGYGSDTTTNAATGAISKITQNSVVSMQDASADLTRRVSEFQGTIRNQIGADRFNSLPTGAQAGLTSVGYNYGSLPRSVADAATKGDVQQIAQAVRNLQNDNGGINAGRRNKEADIIAASGKATNPYQTIVEQAREAQAQLQQIGQTGSQQQVSQAYALNQQLQSAVASGDQTRIQAALDAANKFDGLTQSVSSAGNAAGTAAPKIASVGSSAQTATPQVASMGQGIGGLLAPLAQAVPGLGQFGGILSSLISSLFGGGLFGSHHVGGMIGNAQQSRSVSPLVFAGAMRYHTGGMIGLKPGEVPIIGQTGERVLNRQETKEYNAGRVGSVSSSQSQGGGGSSAGGAVNFGDIKLSITTQGGSGDAAKDHAQAKAIGKQVSESFKQEISAYITDQLRPGGQLYRR